MEVRTIQIANTKTQRRYTIESNATTLEELKAQMRQQGIDYDGMTFTEGISKTQLLSDDSLLPQSVMYRGQPTNNLVILLTNTNKQIASGGYPTDRKQFGEFIKKNNLGPAIKNKFGDNWTRISTIDLIEFFQANDKSTATKKEELNKVREEVAAAPAEKTVRVEDAPHAATVGWFLAGLEAMSANNLLYAEDIKVLATLITKMAEVMEASKPKITDDDIDAIIRSL